MNSTRPKQSKQATMDECASASYGPLTQLKVDEYVMVWSLFSVYFVGIFKQTRAAYVGVTIIVAQLIDLVPIRNIAIHCVMGIEQEVQQVLW